MNRKERRAGIKIGKKNLTKWFALGLGGLLGLSHIGMIGMLSRKSNYPVVNLPTGPYTSYQVHAGKDGYSISYKANDPKVMRVERDVKRKGGFLGLGNNTTQVVEEYIVGGATHHGGPVSNTTTWIDPSAQGEGLSARTIECIKAAGGGENTGRLVGGSVAGLAAPSLSSVPVIGWVLAGAATMIGMDQGAEIGGSMATDLKGCEPEENIN
tara:strand:- start:2444 stop:3076 length:633 start_codon:yes stop_codon:yes gene_type:complete